MLVVRVKGATCLLCGYYFTEMICAMVPVLFGLKCTMTLHAISESKLRYCSIITSHGAYICIKVMIKNTAYSILEARMVCNGTKIAWLGVEIFCIACPVIFTDTNAL